MTTATRAPLEELGRYEESRGRVSWGGATALRAAAAAPELVDSIAVIEPEAYALLRTQDAGAYTQICGLRDRWRAHVRAGRWYEAFEQFVDFYNGPGSFARWPPRRARGHPAAFASRRQFGRLSRLPSASS